MIYSTGVAFINENIEKACTLAPFTHVYSFDIGFPPKTLAQLARQFNDSHYTKYLVSFHTPHTIIDKYMFAVENITKIGGLTMHGTACDIIYYNLFDFLLTPDFVCTITRLKFL